MACELFARLVLLLLRTRRPFFVCVRTICTHTPLFATSAAWLCAHFATRVGWLVGWLLVCLHTHTHTHTHLCLRRQLVVCLHTLRRELLVGWLLVYLHTHTHTHTPLSATSAGSLFAHFATRVGWLVGYLFVCTHTHTHTHSVGICLEKSVHTSECNVASELFARLVLLLRTRRSLCACGLFAHTHLCLRRELLGCVHTLRRELVGWLVAYLFAHTHTHTPPAT